MIRYTLFLLIGALSFTAVAAHFQPLAGTAFATHDAKADEETQEELPFKPSTDAMADVSKALADAKADGKLGLVILGANWCHDSRTLISKLKAPEVLAVIEKNYSTVLVDVGELEHGKDVIQRFGMPVIYGTPTVVIVDPATGEAVNRHDMHQWRDAHSISESDIKTYFEKMVKAETRGTPATAPENTELKALLAEVDAFEKKQSERIYKGFALIGPMITMNRSDRPENFGDLWNELRDFRYQITDDLKALKGDARGRIKAGERGIKLSYPDYQPFSWEKN